MWSALLHELTDNFPKGMDIIMTVDDIVHMEITDRHKEVHKYTALEFSSKNAVKSVRYCPGGSAGPSHLIAFFHCFIQRTLRSTAVPLGCALLTLGVSVKIQMERYVSKTSDARESAQRV